MVKGITFLPYFDPSLIYKIAVPTVNAYNLKNQSKRISIQHSSSPLRWMHKAEVVFRFTN